MISLALTTKAVSKCKKKGSLNQGFLKCREAQAAVMTILVDNYDHKSKDKEIQANLAKALEWEKSFVKFMHEYPKKNNVSHLFDLAFNSERSIEDELGTIQNL